MKHRLLGQSRLWRLGLVVVIFNLGCRSVQQSSSQLAESDPAAAAQIQETQPQQSSLEVQTDVDAEAIARWLAQPDGAGPARSFRVRSGKSWGFENLSFISDVSTAEVPAFLRVYYPAGSASPSVSRESSVALGGAQFYAEIEAPQKALRLSYRVRFSDDFNFVKGGKLPGLFGGVGASGGNIPDGSDGFSTRLMWRREGQGEVYAYLPTSERYGTSIGRGRWQFRPGAWTQVEQEVVLNQQGAADGHIRLWVDGTLVIDEPGLTFRTTDALQLDGLFFSTFFGGGDPSWATPEDAYVDFADFTIDGGGP